MSLTSVVHRVRYRWLPQRHTLTAGVLILGSWLLLALLAPWIAPYDPIAQHLEASLLPPGLPHLFGTDNFGRDIFSRVIWGPESICKSA